MRTIYLKVIDNYVEGDGAVACVEGNVNAPRVHVEFEGWEGLSKYATIINSTGQNSVQITLGFDKKVAEETYEFDVPADCCDKEGMMGIAFTGYEVEGEILSTATMKKLMNAPTTFVRVLPSDAMFDDGSITPTYAQKLQSEIDKLETEYHELPDRVAEAQGYANNAAASATSAATSATNAAASESNANTYKNKCESVYNNINGGFVNCGNIAFEDLPPLSSCGVGDMYTITDDFTTTSDFAEGAGVEHVAGTEVFKIKSNKWDVRVSDVATLQAEVEDIQDALRDVDTALGNIDLSLSALDNDKVDKETGKGLSEANFTAAEKTKLAGIAAGANATVVDASLNASSSNPVRNSVVTSAINGKSNQITVEKRSFTIAANGQIWLRNQSVAKSGYTALGVLGFDLDPTAQANNGFTTIYHMFVESNNLQVFGHTNSNGTITVAFYILYVKN